MKVFASGITDMILFWSLTQVLLFVIAVVLALASLLYSVLLTVLFFDIVLS